MRVEVNFKIDFHIENIVRETDKSIEELKEYIDKELNEEIEEFLKYELEDEGLVSINDINIIK